MAGPVKHPADRVNVLGDPADHARTPQATAVEKAVQSESREVATRVLEGGHCRHDEPVGQHADVEQEHRKFPHAERRVPPRADGILNDDELRAETAENLNRGEPTTPSTLAR